MIISNFRNETYLLSSLLAFAFIRSECRAFLEVSSKSAAVRVAGLWRLWKCPLLQVPGDSESKVLQVHEGIQEVPLLQRGRRWWHVYVKGSRSCVHRPIRGTPQIPSLLQGLTQVRKRTSIYSKREYADNNDRILCRSLSLSLQAANIRTEWSCDS